MLIPNVPMADYVADRFHAGPPSLSSGLAHVLLTRSALHCWTRHARLNPAWAPDDDREFDMGTAAHAVFLESKALSVGTFPDYRTNAAKAWRDACRATGEIPALAHQAEAVKAMALEARRKLSSPDLQRVGGFAHVERTILWDDGEAWLRCRPDAMAEGYQAIYSYKTTGNAEPDAFLRVMVSHGYDMQMAFELAGVKAATGVDAAYVWLAQEVTPPYACSLIGVTPQWLAFAQAKFRAAVTLWSECLKADDWEGYSDRICYLDLPAWMEARAMERGIGAPPPDDNRPIEEVMFEKGIMP